MDWQKIESAPKDGTYVIAYAPFLNRHFYACAKWEGFPDGSCGWVGGTFHSDPRGVWSSTVAPTHWTPLPAAPKGADDHA